MPSIALRFDYSQTGTAIGGGPVTPFVSIYFTDFVGGTLKFAYSVACLTETSGMQCRTMSASHAVLCCPSSVTLRGSTVHTGYPSGLPATAASATAAAINLAQTAGVFSMHD